MQLKETGRPAESRVRWLAELADAIENAQRLAWQLGTATRPSAEARQLYGRLEAARIEVESMRGIGVQAAAAEPAWLDALGWSGSLLDRKNHTPSGNSPPPENGCM